MRRWIIVGLLCLSCVGAATGAVALATTSGGATTTLVRGISLGDDGFQLASDADGASTVIWAQQQSVNGVGGSSVLYARQQNAAGSWDGAIEIGGVTQIDNQQLVESGSGAAAIIWNYYDAGGRPVIAAVTRATAYGAWSAPQIIVSGPSAEIDSAQLGVGIDAAGVVTVVWSAGRGANPAISAASVNAVTGAVSAPAQVVAEGSGGDVPILAVSGDGAVVLSWQRQLTSVRGHAFTTVRDAEMAVFCPVGGRWGRPTQIGAYSQRVEGAGSNAWGPGSATSTVTANGTAGVTWCDGGPGDIAPLDVATRDPDTGRWSTDHVLTHNVGGFGLVRGPGESLVAVWSQDTARESELLSATGMSDRGSERWSTAGVIERIAGGTYGPDLNAEPGGLVALTPETGNASAVRYAARSVAGVWSGLATAGTGENSEITFGPAGRLTLVWQNFYRRGSGYADELSSRTVG